MLQNIFLLAASLFFYAWGEPEFVLILMGSILVNWLFGILIHRYRERAGLTKALLAVDISLNLLLLFIFKYLTFSLGLIQSLTGYDSGIPEIALPIGISFFTFQSISYVVDVYRGNGEAQKNPLLVGFYIAFFPQLIAGPIVRYETVAWEIENRKDSFEGLCDGFARFVVGLSKKVLLANNLAILADHAFDTVASGGKVSVMFGWLGAVAYTLQIFFDFSGYSDMAIGLGRMFGFHFLENFDHPYISTSITEFWRRWHISLGTWFRDYLYIPLGGNRCSKARNIFNLFVVWSLTGLWHGANITFVLWGLMFFLLLVFEKETGLAKKKGALIDAIKRVYTLLFVILGWILFRSEDVSCAITYLRTIFGLEAQPLCDGMFRGWFTQNVLLLVICVVLCTPLFRIINDRLKENAILKWTKPVLLSGLFLLSVASLVSNSYNPFIYFNF